VGDARRPRARGRRVTAALIALFAAALLSGCGEPAATSADPFEGYWAGGGTAGMRLVHIVKDDDSYQVFANPDFKAPAAAVEDDTLVIDAHAVKMTLTPTGTDELTLELSGDVLEATETTALKRVDETQYADAAVGLGLTAIRRGLAMWKAGGGKSYPPASEVTAEGALGQMMTWPNNLFTGEPMQPGQTKGDYVYKQVDGGKEYSLIGYLSDGDTVGK
jgi:hypothetical protein